MAFYSLLFGHAEWPEENKPRAQVYRREHDEAERTARLNLSVPVVLKGRVEASARLEGVSSDAWIVRALSRSVDPRLAP
ncbi:MAG: hypothetical protein ACRDN6_07920 [Gaiellaceae bacterium]